MNPVRSRLGQRRTGAAPRTAAHGRGVEKYFPIREGALQRVMGHVRAVDGVSFDIRRGETAGFVGESGCGKTTLGRCVAGFTEPTGGAIYFRLSEGTQRRLTACWRCQERAEQRSGGEGSWRTRSARPEARISSARRGEISRRNCQFVFQDSFTHSIRAIWCSTSSVGPSASTARHPDPS